MKTFVMLAAGLMAGAAVQAQQPSGVIQYEVNSKIELGQFRMVMRGADGSVTTSNTPPPDMPDLVTFNQTFTFAGGMGRIETEGGGNMMRRMTLGTPAAGLTFSAAGAPPAGAPSAGTVSRSSSLRPPVINTMYIDLVNKRYLSVLTREKDSIIDGAWYSEEAYKPAAELKTSGKTKTIAGYRCQRATANLGEESFVIWYTTEIPMLFSPVNGVWPPQGVVLALESSKRSYMAKKVELRSVADAPALPAGAEKVTAAELKEKQRSIMEAFHNEQLKKLQEAE
ncbi:hypothetical protein WJU16_13350 [Chitinophaga pollutisoli]|uniref:GLPGLI family protein n=1 Tax=Chitinophaga pollutisoli TaxID=3133966 RepID=A0ABZ2YJ18_9BACT